MISLHVFAIGYLSLIFAARIFAELYVYYTEHKESLSNRGNDQTGVRTNNKAVQRYYSMKSAYNHTNRKGA